MTKKEALKILREKKRRDQRKQQIDLEKETFGPQRAFVEDKSVRKLACCSRRAGKSHGLAVALDAAATANPKSIVVYINQARADAEGILWPALTDLNDRYNRGYKFDRSKYDVHLQNGSVIWSRGISSLGEIAKLRGPKYPLVVIDEAQEHVGPTLKYVVDEVLSPATMDYGGTIIMTGTPNRFSAGMFYEADMGTLPGWSRHHWTVTENPHIPNAEEWLEEERMRRGLSADDSAYLREFRGQWVKDNSTTVFDVNDKLNVIDKFDDDGGWTYILGLDFGSNDSNAFVVVAYNPMRAQAVFVDCYKDGSGSDSMSMAQIEAMICRFEDYYPISTIVGDAGGGGKQVVENMLHMFGRYIQPAEKGKKAANAMSLASDIRSGRVLFDKENTLPLREEMAVLQWDPKRQAVGKLEYLNGLPDHLCDAALYAWRECQHHNRAGIVLPPTEGDREYRQWMEDKIEAEHMANLIGKNKKNWWHK